MSADYDDVKERNELCYTGHTKMTSKWVKIVKITNITKYMNDMYLWTIVTLILLFWKTFTKMSIIYKLRQDIIFFFALKIESSHENVLLCLKCSALQLKRNSTIV
jgi:hypothetical protein